MLTEDEIYDLYLYSSHPESDIKAFSERWPMLDKDQVNGCMLLASRIRRSLGFISDHLNVTYEAAQENVFAGNNEGLIDIPARKYNIEFNY